MARTHRDGGQHCDGASSQAPDLLARTAGPRQPSGGTRTLLGAATPLLLFIAREVHYLRISCIGRDHLVTGPALGSPQWCGPRPEAPMRPGRRPFAATIASWQAAKTACRIAASKSLTSREPHAACALRQGSELA
jgi:hypothetical protein